MKKWILLLLLIPAVALAGFGVDCITNPEKVDGITEPAEVDGVTSDYGFDCSPYYICQHFEGAGYDNGETWTETLNGATIDEDYAVSPLEGSQSLQIVDGGADGNVEAVFTAQGDEDVFNVYFRIRVDVDVDSNQYLYYIQDGGDVGGAVALRATGELYLNHGTATNGGSTDVSGGGEFHVWIDWKTEVGSGDGIMHLFVAATGTKPGAAEATITTGTGDRPGIDGFYFWAKGGSTIVYDRVLIDNTTIGSQ